MVSVNWLLNDEPMSPKDSLALELADDLLVGTSAATLRKALTDSGLGESVIGGGLSSELLQNTYSIGLKVGAVEGRGFCSIRGYTGRVDTFFGGNIVLCKYHLLSSLWMPNCMCQVPGTGCAFSFLGAFCGGVRIW